MVPVRGDGRFARPILFIGVLGLSQAPVIPPIGPPAFRRGFDLLVCDTGGGLDAACAVADLFPFVLVVSEQSQTSIRAAEYAASRLERAGAGLLRLCVCSFDLEAVRRERRAGMIEMIDSSALQCVGVVPYDKTLQRAQDSDVLPGRRSRAASAYRNIARRIMGYSVPLFDGMPALARRTRQAL